MNNSTETNYASTPLGIFASKSFFRKTNLGGVGTPPYVAKTVSLSDWQIRPYADWLFITIDINGINKKPNRWGHDLFTFRVEGNGKLIPLADPKGDDFFKNKATYCSKTANNNRNGIACAYYAINDVCPDDNTKSYWKCLP